MALGSVGRKHVELFRNGRAVQHGVRSEFGGHIGDEPQHGESRVRHRERSHLSSCDIT